MCFRQTFIIVKYQERSKRYASRALALLDFWLAGPIKPTFQRVFLAPLLDYWLAAVAYREGKGGEAQGARAPPSASS